MTLEEMARSALIEYKGMKSATDHLVQYHNIDRNKACMVVYKEHEKIKVEMKKNHLLRFLICLPIALLSIPLVIYVPGVETISISFFA